MASETDPPSARDPADDVDRHAGPQRTGDAGADDPDAYRLDHQVGFLLRQAIQRHTAIFAEHMPGGLTTTQFAALARLREVGACSQNHLGRLTAMDVATIKGVVDRLRGRGLVDLQRDTTDRRRVVILLTEAGADLVDRAIVAGFAITRETLAPLDGPDQADLLRLLTKLT